MAPTAGLVQRLKAAAGDPDRILELVQEAERSNESQQALSEIYGIAVDAYGQIGESKPDHAFTDLCVKRMRLLCRLDPTEARQFHNRLRAFTTGFIDSRVYQARAAMEEKLGDTAKAIKMLKEGLQLGAEPAEALQRALNKLIGESPKPENTKSPGVADAPPESPSPSPAPALGSRFQASSWTPPAAMAPPLPTLSAKVSTPVAEPANSSVAAPLVSTPARAASSSPPPGNCDSFVSAASTAITPRDGSQLMERSLPSVSTLQPSQRAPAPVLAPCRTTASPHVPKILYLGPYDRNDRGAEEDESEEEEEDQDEQERTGRQDNLTTTSMMPLSPIKEASLPEEDTAGSTHLNGTPLPPPGSTAPRAIVCAAAAGDSTGGSVGQKTPHKVQDKDKGDSYYSLESNTPRPEEVAEQPSDTGKASKTISVNGVEYTQLQTIGRGGSSKVYLVQGPDRKVVALKRVTTECAKSLEAFQNEVTLLQQLRNEKCVIQVIDAEVDRDRKRIHIVMEAGEMDLTRFLLSEPRLTLTKVQNLWRQMLEAVQVIHRARIVHSDLKPGNFLLVNGQLKVIDFGIAKRISNDTTNISREASIGTLSYMAPEAIKQGQLKLGRSSDIWSLGIILYQLVYRTNPFAHLEPIQRVFMLNDPMLTLTFPEGHCLEDYSSAVQADLVDVLKGCLQRDPRRRLSSQALLEHPFLTNSDQELEHQLQRAMTAEKRIDELQRLLEEEQASKVAAEQRAAAASEQQAQHEAAEQVLSSLMAGMRQVVGDALQVPESALQEYNWDALADEVAQRIRGAGRGEVGNAEFRGLATFKERFSRWTSGTVRQPLLQKQGAAGQRPASPAMCKGSYAQNARTMKDSLKENAPPVEPPRQASFRMRGA